jgi:hypothetical protein
VTGRALVFSQEEVVQRLKSDFVPVAGDKWYLNRQQDADGRFVRQLGAQLPAGRTLPGGAAPQGIYVAAADGTLLSYDHVHPDLERFLALLRRGEEAGKRAPRVELTPTAKSAADPHFARQPPAGGLVLDVFSRIPLPAPSGQDWSPNMATGRDHLWLTQDEWQALLPAEWKSGARYPVPAAISERLLRFHLVDNVRGEPTFWTRNDLRQTDLTLRVEDAEAGRLVLEGTARMQHGEERGYEARVQGYLTYDRQQARLSRCDLLVWGEAWGESPLTRGAPPGRFPLVIAASLAGSTGADRVPPQGSRDLNEYLGKSRS